MQVSAVSANTTKAVLNTKVNSRGSEYYIEFALNNLNSYPKNESNNKSNLYDSITEWKNFCHAQIEKNNLDIMA